MEVSINCCVGKSSPSHWKWKCVAFHLSFKDGVAFLLHYLVAYSLFIWTFYSPHQQFYLTLPSCFSLPRDFAQSGLTSFFWSPFSADCVSLRIHEHHLNARRQWPFVSSPLKWQPCQKCVLASLQVTSEAHICLAFLPLQDFVNPINSFFLPYIFKRFLWWCSIPS